MADVQHQPIAPFQSATNGHHHPHQKIGFTSRSNPKMSDPDPPFLTTTSLVQLSVTYTSLIQQYLNLHCTDNATFLAERYFACTNAPNVVDHNDGDVGGGTGGNISTRMKRAHALYLVAFCYYRQRKLDPCRYLLLQHDSLWNDIRCSTTSSSSKNKKSTKTKLEEEVEEGYHHQEEEQEDNEMEHLSSDIRYLFSTVCYELGYNEEAIQTLLGGISEAEPSSTKRKSSSSSSSDANARQRPHVAELMGHALVTRSSSSSSSSSKHKDSKKDSGDIKLSTGLLNEIPKGAAGLQLLGHLCRVTSRPHIATECYRQALKQDPCLFTSFMALAELCNHDSSSSNTANSNTTTSSTANVEEENSKSSSLDPIIDVESIFGVPLPAVVPTQIMDDNVMSQQEVLDGAGATTPNATLAFPLRYGGFGGNQVTAQFYSGGAGASASDTPTSGAAAICAAAKETPVPASSHMNTTGATPLLARASLHDQPLFKNDHPQQQHQKNNNQYYNQNLTLNLSSLSVKTPYNNSYSMFGAPPPSSTFAGGGVGGGVAIGSAPRLSMASSKGRGPTALFASPDMTPIPKADASTRMQTPTKGGVTSMMGGPSFDVSATNSFMMGGGAGGGGGGTDGGAATAADMSMNSTSVAAAHQHLPMQTPTSAFLKGPPQITRAIETASAVAARLYYHPSPESKPPLSGRRVRFSSIGSAGGGGGDFHGGGGDYPTRKGGAYYYHRRDSYDDNNNYDDHSSLGGGRQQQPYDTHTTTHDDTMDADVTMGDASLLNNTNNTKSTKLRATSDSAPSSPLIGKRSNSSRVGSAKRLFRTASFSKKEKSSGRTTAPDVDYHSETKEEARPSGSTSYHPSGIVAMGTSGLKRRGSSSKDHAVAQQQLPRQQSSSGMSHDAPNNEEGLIVEEVAGGVVVDASEGIVPVLTLLATLGQGYLHLCRYECEEALEVFRNQLSSEQYYTGWVLHQIGKAYFEMLNFHQTKRILEHMHYLEPHRIEGLEVLSTTLWHLKDEIALSSLSQKVSELDPTSPECWCVVGNTFSLQKDHDTALSFFQRAIQVNPRFTYAHTLCGHEYRENEDLDQALKCYRHAIQLDPRHYNAWYGLASIFARQEKYEFAEYHYQRAIQIHPRSAVLLYHLATVQNARGLPTQALTTLDKVYQINPNYDQARFLRANIYMSDGRHEAALQELIHVRNNMPMESSVYFSMGKMYKALGRKSDALNCFVTALDLDPKNDNNLIKSAMDRIDEEDIEEDISTF